jgi:hypothetical protein
VTLKERAAAAPLSPTALAEAEARAGAAAAELLAMLELEEAGVDGKPNVRVGISEAAEAAL